MGIFDTILKYAALAVEGYGAATAIMGIVGIANGRKQNNAAEQEEGFNKLVGGGIIFAVGLGVVPLLSTFFKV